MTDTRKLTFGELKVGDRFISWPVPGDNAGHGGYLGARRVFVKIKSVRPTNAHLYSADWYENAAREGDHVHSRISDRAEVIKLCKPADADAVTTLGNLAP